MFTHVGGEKKDPFVIPAKPSQKDTLDTLVRVLLLVEDFDASIIESFPFATVSYNLHRY